MVKSLLKKAQEYIDRASDAEASDECKRARNYYLHAARMIFDAAKQSHGEMKTIRVENAESLIQKANSIKIKNSGNKKSYSSKNAKNADKQKVDDDGKDAESMLLSKKPAATFDDVAGLEEVKKQVRLKLIHPFEHRQVAKKFGQETGGGILLYGPPGTGKTLIAKAIAGEVEADFFSIKPSDLMNQFVGNTEKKIAQLFNDARECQRAVVFIDEIESLLPKRKGQSSTVMARVVPQFLSELDGVDNNNDNLLFLGATNEPWSLDRAALRPGRFDEKIYIPPPDYEARIKLFQLNLKGKPLYNDIDLDELSRFTERYSGADVTYLCKKACSIPFEEFIESGVERDVCMADLLQAMDEIRSSIDQKTIIEYENYMK